MAISSYSSFIYGFKITALNQFINFDEGSGELTATVEAGTYSLTDFLLAVKTAMEAASGLPQEYTLTVDRVTRQITISSAAAFDLLIGTGTQIGSSPWALMGFTGGTDLTGATTYTSDSGAGSEYVTQFPLQDYVEGDDFQQRIDPSVNEAASGAIEVVSFGVRKFFEMSFKFISDLPQDGKVIRNNPTGRADARAFFEAITERGPFEFMPDVEDKNTYFTVILETAPGGQKGTGFQLKELTSSNLPNYYEITKVRLRVVE